MPPKWTEIVKSEKFKGLQPKKQEELRQRWVGEVTQANPHWKPEQIESLKRKTMQTGIFAPATVPQGQGTSVDPGTIQPPKPGDAVLQPAIAQEGEQPVKREERKYDFPKDLPLLAGQVARTNPIFAPIRGFIKGGIGGAVGATAAEPARQIKEVAQELVGEEGWKRVVAVANVGGNTMLAGLQERQKELRTVDWAKQPKTLRLQDIKEVIKDKGFRQKIDSPIPFDYSLPDKIHDAIQNGFQEGKTPEEIDKKIMSMYKRGDMKDVPLVADRNKIMGEPGVSTSADYLGAQGISWRDYIISLTPTLKGMQKGFLASGQGKFVSTTDLRKQLYGKTYEEKYGMANGMALSLLGDIATDPLVALSIPAKMLQGVANRVILKQTKNAQKTLATLVAYLKHHEGKAQKAAYARLKKKGVTRNVNLLQDSLEQAKKRPRGFNIVRKQLTTGAKKIKEAPTPKRITGKVGGAIEQPGVGTKGYNVAGKEATQAVPVGPATEAAVYKAAREGAIKEGTIVRKQLGPAAEEGRKALPDAGKKALAPAPSRKKLGPATIIPLKRGKYVGEAAPSAVVRSGGGAYKQSVTTKLKKGDRTLVYFDEPMMDSTLTLPKEKLTVQGVKNKIDDFQKGVTEQMKKWVTDAGGDFRGILVKGRDIEAGRNPHSLLVFADPATKIDLHVPLTVNLKKGDIKAAMIAEGKKHALADAAHMRKTAPGKKIGPSPIHILQKGKRGKEATIKFGEAPRPAMIKLSKQEPKALAPTPARKALPEGKLNDQEKLQQFIDSGKVTKVAEQMGKKRGEQVVGLQAAKNARAKDMANIGIDPDDVLKDTGYASAGGDPSKITKESIEDAMRDGTYLPNFLGGFQKFFDRRAVQKAAGSEGIKKWNKSPFSVVKPWNEIDKPKTGIAIKNIYSKSEEYAERGIQWMKQLSKEGRTGKWSILKRKRFTIVGKNKAGKAITMEKKPYTNKDLSDIVLLAESKEKWEKLPLREKVRLQKGVKIVREFFDWAKNEYKKGGADLDFKQRMQDVYNSQMVAIRDLVTDLKTDTRIQGYDRAILKNLGFDTKGLPQELTRKQMAKYLKEQFQYNQAIMKRLDDMEFVHIPYDMWFESGKVNKAGTLKALRIANAQKRKTIMIDDLIKGGAIDPKDINAFDIMASYTHRMSKDMAMLNLKKVARAEGLLSKEKLTGFQKLPAFQAPMFNDVYMHPAFKDWMLDFKFQTFNQNMLDNVFSTVKMWQFAKPLFLPYYDMFQHIVAKSFSNPLHVGRDAYDAAKMMFKKNKDYYDYIGGGISSRPIDVPWNQFEDTLNSLKGTSFGDFMLKSMKNKNWTIIKPVYNVLWETAWTMDKFVRLMTGNYLHKSLKMPKGEAAQLAALFHSDYANVPIATRRALNKVFFTPTFKITMFRLYKEMAKNMLSVPVKMATGKTVTTAEKQLAKGGVATVGGVMIGFDQLMTRGFGYERDQFARRYYKKVPDPNIPGETQDHVVVFSNPLTMLPKYMYKANKIWQGMAHDDKLNTIINTMKWEIHPIYRIANNVARNLKDNGDPIVWPHEDGEEFATAKKFGYALKESMKVLEAIPGMKEEDQVEAFKMWRKDVGFLMTYLNQPATFSYLRKPKLIGQGMKIRGMQAEFTKTLGKMDRKGLMDPEKETKMIKNFEAAMDKEIEKLEGMIEKHDSDLHKSWVPSKKKKEAQPKAPPYISVPGYKPEA